VSGDIRHQEHTEHHNMSLNVLILLFAVITAPSSLAIPSTSVIESNDAPILNTTNPDTMDRIISFLDHPSISKLTRTRKSLHDTMDSNNQTSFSFFGSPNNIIKDVAACETVFGVPAVEPLAQDEDVRLSNQPAASSATLLDASAIESRYNKLRQFHVTLEVFHRCQFDKKRLPILEYAYIYGEQEASDYRKRTGSSIQDALLHSSTKLIKTWFNFQNSVGSTKIKMIDVRDARGYGVLHLLSLHPTFFINVLYYRRALFLSFPEANPNIKGPDGNRLLFIFKSQ
jgi:hypothetical protein